MNSQIPSPEAMINRAFEMISPDQNFDEVIEIPRDPIMECYEWLAIFDSTYEAWRESYDQSIDDAELFHAAHSFERSSQATTMHLPVGASANMLSISQNPLFMTALLMIGSDLFGHSEETETSEATWNYLEENRGDQRIQYMIEWGLQRGESASQRNKLRGFLENN